jgi:hypothetical protein
LEGRLEAEVIIRLPIDMFVVVVKIKFRYYQLISHLKFWSLNFRFWIDGIASLFLFENTGRMA